MWLTARRAGLQRSFYRLDRRLRLQLLNPHLAHRLYPWPVLQDSHLLAPFADGLLDQLKRLVCLRRLAASFQGWDQEQNTVRLLNQTPYPLRPPVDWLARPVDDPLWSFQLNSWDWAWPALVEPAGRQAVRSLWLDWLDQARIGHGVAWEPYPTSRRLIVWSLAWHMLGRDKRFAAAIAQQAAYLARHLERDLDNNHLVANAKALAWAGLLLPDLPGASIWRRQGLARLWDALQAQVREDGGHVENSTGYHLSVWLDGLETMLLCRACGGMVPDNVSRILVTMGEYALALRRPDGRLPLLNDSIEDEPLPATALFDLAAMAFNRADFAWAAGKKDANTTNRSSQMLADSGYAVLRSGSPPKETYLVFDFGNLGPDHCPGHGHADTLSFELWSQGEALVVDPGTYQYPAGRWRNYFRSTAAHSTATVDHLDQSCFAGPFRVADMAQGKLISHSLDKGRLEVVGEHNGYTRLADPVIHRRHLRLFDAKHLTIVDYFSGAGHHHLALQFHLAPCEASLIGPDGAIAIYPGGTRLQLHCASSPPGRMQLEEGWVSRTWYQKETSPTLMYVLATKFPITITTTITIS
jgi:uncharacterized heparinase superfamily protein